MAQIRQRGGERGRRPATGSATVAPWPEGGGARRSCRFRDLVHDLMGQKHGNEEGNKGNSPRAENKGEVDSEIIGRVT